MHIKVTWRDRALMTAIDAGWYGFCGLVVYAAFHRYFV